MKLKAYAKLNLTLDLCGKREDGYHLLDSVMQSVDLADILIIEKSDHNTVGCSLTELNGENNICMKAVRAFGSYTGIDTCVDIRIEKHIPQAAGMGGGSADAAAVILALDRLYNTDLPTDELCRIGLSVGADVPFCIIGGTARVGGVGELITPTRSIPDCFIVGYKDGMKLSTKEMYQAIDESPFCCRSKQTENAVRALRNQDLKALGSAVSNDFLSVTDHADVVNELLSFCALGASLSGSGPTVFGIFDQLNTAKKAVGALREKGKEVFLAHPIDCGVLFE